MTVATAGVIVRLGWTVAHFVIVFVRLAMRVRIRRMRDAMRRPGATAACDAVSTPTAIAAEEGHRHQAML